MPINIKGHVDTRRYNPSRDIAYAWPNLMQAALAGYDKEVDEPITKELIEKFGVDDAALGELAGRYANYFKECLAQGDKGYKLPEEALAACGFFDLPPGHQAVLLARLGQVITGAFFYAIKDTFVDSDEPPFSDAKIIEAGFVAKQAFLNKRKPKWYTYITKPWLLFK